ncbi:hypothetical protein BJ322DRAFT_997417 [Thelephora terrestris]|uniref:peptidylprolyl isomerase n=1 Tax=Thelephora terrestris TaxID=56493 RepID=A0A9P6HRB1_9AGAM|nr:hypothetical protein BJ322DRAFT_997417 [Thelephora terrestris]
MLVLKWLSVLAFAAFAASADTDVPELVIDKTYVPADCSVKSQKGDKIRVHYTGKLINGNKFDSSHDRNEPLPLTLGAGQVIPGWEEGLLDMCVNEKRVLTIPSRKAYGARGFGKVIPPSSALVFEVELVGLEPTTREEL